MKRKVCVVLTARASYAKLKTVLQHLKTNEQVELQLVCAGSALLGRFGNLIQTVQDDGFFINESLNFLIEGEDHLTNTKSVGLGLIEFAGAFDRLQPDVVVVMADRFEVLVAAIAASYQNIPLAHIQGGEVSGNIDEKVRHAITKLADLHFPATKRAMDWIIRMGEQADRVFHTGCPSVDLAQSVLETPELDFDVYERYGGVGNQPVLDEGYVIVMQHAVTTEPAQSREHILETLCAVTDMPYAALWFWPNPDAGTDEVSKTIRAFREQFNPENIHFFKSMEPVDFLRLLNGSRGIIGNSSAAIREASYLGVPAVNIGSRQINRERGPNVIDVDYSREAILKAVKEHFNEIRHQSDIYGKAGAGKEIAEILSKVSLTYFKNINYLNDCKRELEVSK